ncbi:hypothetical protein [Pseudobutyrivibrio sp. MD2005]|uniref:hypothetical protein n=1 Tax=Pseudobutyrivibrio sp. MD2005 TaxID=1410616 RepID=UPI000488ACC1|nr:hypothetical protein [Pseudobutyrivibrio sp. MD2005]
MEKVNETIDEELTIELPEGEFDLKTIKQTVLESPKFKEYYGKMADSGVEVLAFYEDHVMKNIDALTRKIQTWDIETVKTVPADELEQTFLALYDNIYVLIQNVNPFWQVGMERLKLLKDYQDLYIEMLKVRGEF